MNPGQHPLLILVLLLAGSVVVALLPPAWRRARLGAGAVACLLGLAVVADLAPLVASGPLSPTFGDIVAGVPLTLRADATGLALVVMSVSAALLALTAPGRRSGEEAAILLTAAGASTAALAGNAAVLFAGIEVANLGGLLLARAAAGRLSRGALTAFAIQHLFGLGLLAAAVELIVASGTSDPLALPAAAIGVGIAVPWGLAGASRLLAAAWWPGPAAGRATRAALAVGSIPSGGAVLLRLLGGLGAAEPAALTISLGVLGAAAALGGGWLAWNRRSDPPRCGRALLVAAAGPVLALAGVPGGAGAAAAGLVALQLAAMAAPAWSQGFGRDIPSRVTAALALLAAGGLPVGFGTAALVAELGGVAAQGPGYAALLMGLGAGAAVAALASVASARRVLAGSGARASPRRLRADAVAALAAGALAALLPGAAAQVTLVPLAGPVAPRAPDLVTLTGAGGAWPGGYLSFALLAVLVMAGCAAVMLGRSLPHPSAPEAEPRPLPLPRTLLRSRRSLTPVRRVMGGVLAAADGWLETQPGLIFAVAAAIAAILLFK